MNYLKNIKLLYANRFFHNLVFAYVIERLFWQQRGMSVQHVVYTEIIYAAAIIALEIPTGILADKWSRKNLLVIGAALTCFEFLILIFSHSFWQFGAAVFIAGVSTSLASGSEYALLYDSLKCHGRENTFEKVLGRLLAFDFTAAIIACLSGSLLAARLGFEFNYWLSLASVSIAFFITLFLSETKIHTINKDKPKFSHYIKASFKFFKNSGQVLLVIVSGMLIAACVIYVDEFWQLYLDRLLIPVIFFGVFSSLTSLVRVPGSLLSYKLKNKLGYKSVFVLLFTAAIIALLAMAFVKGAAGIVSILVICLAEGLTEPLASGYLHKRVPSRMRATIDSFQSLVQRILSIVIGLGFGFAAVRLSFFAGYGLMAALCAAYLVFFTAAGRKAKL